MKSSWTEYRLRTFLRWGLSLTPGVPFALATARNVLAEAAATTWFLVNTRRHCVIRFNEVHDYERGIRANAEETFLVHGDVFEGGGRATAANIAL